MKYFIIAALIFCFVAGCEKNNTGENTDAHVNIKHHNNSIKGAALYVKFDATELSSDPTNNYNLKEQGCLFFTDIHVE